MTDRLADADAGFLDRLSRRAPGLRLGEAEPRHITEPRGKWPGRPGPVAKPSSTEEVAAIVAEAAASRVGIIPISGGTGLVAGQTMAEGPLPLLLSLERMTRIRDLNAGENTAVAEAGVTLDALRGAAREADRLFPLVYASSGTACLGGALSVNSGGLNVLRYGMARNLVLGIEAVLPDGSVMHGLKRLRKDNTGYDLRHLLIGAEGTLGVITAASVALHPRPAEAATAHLAVPSPEAALRLLTLAREIAGDMVSAFELIDGQGLAFLARELPQVRQPLGGQPKWSVLIEIETPASVPAEPMMMALYEAGDAEGLITDGVLAESAAQRDALWAVRETIPEANRLTGAIGSHDISLPLAALPDYIRAMTEELTRTTPFRINAFGHLGDGNLHFNVFAPEGERREDHAAVAAELTAAIHARAVALGGSFSAEHGVGRAKAGDLRRFGDPAKLAAMRAIKAALDPQGIMNPGAIFG